MSKELGNKIREIRRNRRLSQGQMADILGYSSKGMVSRLENDSAEMSYDKLMKLLSEFQEEFSGTPIEGLTTPKDSDRPLNEEKRSYTESDLSFCCLRAEETLPHRFETIRFEQGNLALDVNVSPSEETVWLSLKDLCLLFERDKSVVSRHIKNIFAEGELDRKQTVAKNATVRIEGNKPIKRSIEYFNLDVIISVGYRVKSKNGIAFRKWANAILKEYLIKGYVLNEKRTLITNDNYVNLVHRVEDIDKRLGRLEKDNSLPNESIFFDGQYYDARAFLKNLVSSSHSNIILIDPYSDVHTLDYLKSKETNVKALLIISKKSRLTPEDIDSFNKQYGRLRVEVDDSFHDRFLIVDKADLYHLGASLNYAGRKTFAVTKMNEPVILCSLFEKLSENYL